MEQLEQFGEFSEIVRYKKRVKGATLAALGWDPEETSPSQLERLFDLIEDKEIEIRIDPLLANRSLHTTLISEERAKRPIKIKPKEEVPSDRSSCDFCKPRIYLETPVPKIHHGRQQIVTVPNLFPFISPHYVTVFSDEHKPNLEDLTERDIAIHLSTGKELAYKIREEGYDGMWDFINWGATAGGSQPHAHSQRGGLYKLMRSLMDKESEALNERKRELKGKDPFEVYMELARDSPLLIQEDDNVFIFAPFAPRFTDQVDIFTKKRNGRPIPNYLELEEDDILSISRGMVKALKKLGTKRGITDFNVETHQARFRGDDNYRMHWHVYPRKSLIAGMELNDIYIVSAYPEHTARALAEQTPK